MTMQIEAVKNNILVLPPDEAMHEQAIIIPQYIDRPDLQSNARRGVLGVLNSLGWMIWIYLLMPFISVIAWLFGYYRFNGYVVHDQPGTWAHLLLMLVLVGIMSVLLIGWASYNLLRFRNNERRLAVTNVTVQQVAQFYELDSGTVQRVQQQQVSTFYYDDVGKIVDIQ